MCSEPRQAITPGALLVALCLSIVPAATSAEEFKLAAGQGNRVCVAVGETKYQFNFRTDAQLYVDYEPKDVARASIANNSLVTLGLKPGQTIVKVSRLEFRPALKKDEEVTTWFIVNVTEKATTDKCLCEGRGEKQCPGAPVTAGAGPGPGDKTKGGIAGAFDPKTTVAAPTSTPPAAKPGVPAAPGERSGGGSGPATPSAPSRPTLPFDLPRPPASPGPAVGSGGPSTAAKKPGEGPTAEVGADRKEADKKEKDGAPTEAGAPEPLTASETVFLDTGKSKTAKFRKQVEGVKLATSNGSIATVDYRDGFGVTIKGHRPGRATITVRGDIVRFEARPGALQQDLPFVFTYNIVVREAKGEAGKPATPRPNSFVEEMTLAAGKTYRESFNRKAVVDLRVSNTSEGTATATVADNVLTIKGVEPGFAVVTVRFKIAEGSSAPEAVLVTYRVKVQAKPSQLARDYYALRTRCTERSVKKLETVTLPGCDPACRELVAQALAKFRETQQQFADRYARFQSGKITEDEFFGSTVPGTSKDEQLKRITESLAAMRKECGDAPTVVAEAKPTPVGEAKSGLGMDYILNPTDLLDSPGASAGADDDLSGGLKPPPLPARPPR